MINKEKGVSLLLAVLVSSVLLAVSLGVSAILINQIRMIKGMGDSVVAFYAADNGVEEMLYNLYKTVNPEDVYEGFLGEASYYVKAKCCNPGFERCIIECPDNFETDSDCETTNFCLNSTGTYNQVKRAIEVEY